MRLEEAQAEHDWPRGRLAGPDMASTAIREKVAATGVQCTRLEKTMSLHRQGHLHNSDSQRCATPPDVALAARHFGRHTVDRHFEMEISGQHPWVYSRPQVACLAKISEAS